MILLHVLQKTDMAEKAMHVLLVFLSYSPGYDVFQGGSRHVPAIFPHTCAGRRLLSFMIPEEGRRLLHGKGRKKASCPCRAGSGSASSCRIRRAPCVFSARRTRKACRAFREEGRTYPLRSSTEKAGQKGGRPPLILRLRENALHQGGCEVPMKQTWALPGKFPRQQRGIR